MRKLLLVLIIILMPSLTFADNQPPIADAGPDLTAIQHTMIRLDGTGSYDPDGTPILGWFWRVVSMPADAAYPLAWENTPEPLFTGTAVGEYVLVLSVADGESWSLNDFVTVSVVANQPPVAIINATPTSGPVPLTVQFDATQSYDPEGMALQFDWTFGDGRASPEPVVSHEFVLPGTYDVLLSVVDAYGVLDRASLVITVLPPFNNPPVASPTATPNTGNAPLTVQFAANASDADNDPLTYAWDFGDGAASIEADPMHTYSTSGTYTAQLIVSDSKDAASYPLTIVVNPAITMAVQRVEVKMQGGKNTLGGVELTASVVMSTPTATAMISMTFDGIQLFSAAIANFETSAKEPNVYSLKDKNMLVKLNLTTGELTVVVQKVNLAGMDNTNGVDVQLNVDLWTAVQKVTLVDGKGNRLIYTAPTP